MRTLARFDDVQLAAVADVQPERATALAGTVDATPYAGLGAMLDDEELDAVHVCVPPFAHGEPELAVPQRGLPFFVEKPLAADAGTTTRIAAAVREHGVVTGVGYHWRWLDTVERIPGLLAGRPARLVLGTWLDATPPVPRWQLQKLSGGQLVEQATHLADAARLLVGEVEEVVTRGSRTLRASHPGCDVDDVTTASVRFAGGAVGTFAATCLLGGPHAIGLSLYLVGGEETEVRLLAQHLRPEWTVDVVVSLRRPGMPEQSHRQLAELGVPLNSASRSTPRRADCPTRGSSTTRPGSCRATTSSSPATRCRSSGLRCSGSPSTRRWSSTAAWCRRRAPASRTSPTATSASAPPSGTPPPRRCPAAGTTPWRSPRWSTSPSSTSGTGPACVASGGCPTTSPWPAGWAGWTARSGSRTCSRPRRCSRRTTPRSAGC